MFIAHRNAIFNAAAIYRALLNYTSHICFSQKLILSIHTVFAAQNITAHIIKTRRPRCKAHHSNKQNAPPFGGAFVCFGYKTVDF